MRPGDEIVVTDPSLLTSSGAISDTNLKGKWWRRRYTVPDDPDERALVCVEQHDPDDPRSCLVGQLTLPLKLSGWYEIWVRTYRHRRGGGIDVRLSNEAYFLHADPLEVEARPGEDHAAYGALVDILFRAADLTGQSLVFQQPQGTHGSMHKLCNASLAGVRLVKLSDEQVARVNAERARDDVKVIGFDNDGFSYWWQWGERTRDCAARLLEPPRDQSGAFLNMELGGLGGLIVPTPYTEMYQMMGHDRDGDLRANAFFRWSFENDANILDILTERAHELGLKLFASMMQERSFSRDKTMREHPEWRVKRGPGTWDYAIADVRDYQVAKIAWICERYDIDGFIVDYTRYGRFFNQDEPADKRRAYMNAYVRQLREAIDRVNAEKTRKVALCASFGEHSGHMNGWKCGDLNQQGLDVATWLEEDIFDMIMPEGATNLSFVKMAKAKNSRTRVWPRHVAETSFETGDWNKGRASFSGDGSVSRRLGPKAIERGVKMWFDAGADGIFFFNRYPGVTPRRLGFKEELELRTKVANEIHGYREGPVVAFASWYPDLDKRAKQRDSFKPLTIETNHQGSIDSTIAIPVRNTFDHRVTARVSWQFPADERPVVITPSETFVDVKPGQQGQVDVHITGKASGWEAMPRAKVELTAEGQTLLLHSLPLRGVPELVCRRTAAPAIDGKLDDPAWTEAGGLKPEAFFIVGQPGAEPLRTSLAAVHDDTTLYVAYQCPANVALLDKNQQERNSRAVFQSDHVELLIDADGSEQAYKLFAATPAGGQAARQVNFVPFQGHFSGKDWQADWTARAALNKDHYSIEMAIPFAAIGATPKAGDIWRMNVAGKNTIAGGKAVTSSWSSRETSSHLPRHFGTLFGTLRFD